MVKSVKTAPRLLLVHAHPDDETIGSGATMAKYVAQGAQVTLVTCTLGEEGEILVSDLAHLASDKTDGLGSHRFIELGNAMAELSVSDWRLLGGAGKYRDSGMIGTPPNERLDNFWRSDLLEAAKHLVEIIREVKPQVLVTYDDFGGYGHPDHIQAHRVAHYARELAAAKSFAPELGEPWLIEKHYAKRVPLIKYAFGLYNELISDSNSVSHECIKKSILDVSIVLNICSLAIFKTLRTLSSGISMRSASSSGVASRPISCKICLEILFNLLIVSIICTGIRIVLA